MAFAFGRRSATAVMRNRARRRLRALFRELAHDLAPGRYLVGARVSAHAVTYRQARTELTRLLATAGALTGSAER